MKKILISAAWIIALGAVIALLSFVNKERSLVRCGKLEIVIDEPEGNRFITEEDVREAAQNMGYAHGRNAACQIDIQHLEHTLSEIPVVETANVYATIDGNIRVAITQRQPIARILSANGDSYYIDKNGWLMPLSKKFTSRSLAVSGFLNEPWILRYHTNTASLISSADSARKHTILHDIYRLAKYIYEDDFWRAQVTQVFINESREFELIPRVGNHVILLGDAGDLDEKFDKLMVFYKKGLSKTGWNEHSVINLKYKNQVVCTKQGAHESI